MHTEPRQVSAHVNVPMFRLDRTQPLHTATRHDAGMRLPEPNKYLPVTYMPLVRCIKYAPTTHLHAPAPRTLPASPPHCQPTCLTRHPTPRTSPTSQQTNNATSA